MTSNTRSCPGSSTHGAFEHSRSPETRNGGPVSDGIENQTLASGYRSQAATTRRHHADRAGSGHFGLACSGCSLGSLGRLEKPWSSKRLAVSPAGAENKPLSCNFEWAARVSNPAPWD